MNKKIFSVISMALGISLSCITNLLTGDNAVVDWFNSNKGTVVIAGIILTIGSLIIAYLSESEGTAEQKESKQKISFFTNLVTSFLTNFIGGAIITVMIIYGLQHFNIDQALIPTIAILLIGIAFGSDFRFVGGNIGTGMIAGAILSYAFSFYFPESFSLEVLPSWLNKNPILPNAIFAAILGMYTGIYSKPARDEERKKDKEDKINETINTQQFYMIRAQLENSGHRLYSSNTIDNMVRQQVDIKTNMRKMASDFDIDLEEEKNKNLPELTPWDMIKKSVSAGIRTFDKDTKFKSPYYIYNQKGECIFVSVKLNEIIDHSKSLTT